MSARLRAAVVMSTTMLGLGDAAFVVADPAGAATGVANARMSLTTGGGAGKFDSGGGVVSVTGRNEVSISGTGRFVAFQSDSALTSNDHNARTDVFVRDRDSDHDGKFDEAGAVRTVIISVTTGGRQEYGRPSSSPSISRTGRFVAFYSYAALTTDDTNGAGDVYVRDRDTDRDGVFDEPGAVATRRVSVSTDGSQGDNDSNNPVITPNGRFVVYSSIATTLAPGLDGDNLQDIYLRDRDSDRDGVFDENGAVRTVLISATPTSAKELTTNEFPTITPNGRFVVWNTLAQGYTSNDRNRAMDIYVRDRDADRDGIFDEYDAIRTKRLSVGLNGRDSNQESQEAAISDNGRWVVFSSQASNLVANDTNGLRDIFVVDRDPDSDGSFDETGANRIKRISVGTRGNQANGRSTGPAISADGRVIVFESEADNISRSSGHGEVLVRDRDVDRDRRLDEAGACATALVSFSRTNGPASGTSLTPVVSANRRWFAFSSYADNLVTHDVNNRVDVFARGPYH